MYIYYSLVLGAYGEVVWLGVVTGVGVSVVCGLLWTNNKPVWLSPSLVFKVMAVSSLKRNVAVHRSESDWHTILSFALLAESSFGPEERALGWKRCGIGCGNRLAIVSVCCLFGLRAGASPGLA